METYRRVGLAILLAIALTAAPLAGAVGGDAVAGDSVVRGADAVSLSSSDAIRLESSLRRVDTRGEYGATSRVSLPDAVTEFRLTLPAGARDVRADGFASEGDGVWRWDGTTEEPALTYRMPANRTVDESGPLEGRGDYLFADAGDWALVRPPAIGASWRSTADHRFVRENRVDGEGAASRAMAFLGPHETVTREANGQRFRLIVPEAAEMAEPPADVLDSMEHASGAMQVGDRDPEVFLVAAPTGEVEWGVRGIQTGDADVWIRDEERLDTADNVWVHEYVHTRQGYRTASSARWFTEGAATYYAALLTLERGGTDFADFRSVLARGERDPQASATLSDPETWANYAQYTKGSLVAGEIDRRLRLVTDGEASLATVFRELNAADDPIDGDRLLRGVEEAGGGDARGTAERYTTTDAVPGTWDRETHDEAFGRLPARIGFSLADAEAVRASGPYRDRPVERDPVRLVTGETLELDATVVNTGGVAGEYDLALTVDGEPVDARSGRIGANETLVESFERDFSEPGEHEVAVGGTRLTVIVSEPATATVSNLVVEPSRVTAGDEVTVTATVSNDAEIPAERDLALVVDGETRSAETIRLDAGESTTYTATVSLDEPGETTIELGDATAAVTVAPAETSADGATGETDSGVPGFGPAVAAAALTLTAVLARWRA
ncbi:CARDB domain-containing protein [Haloparvum sedimenti]|uniref:CARDB domain-containing protein n=1 Tax=Haloparvum sedimenti TaxID=1678448 RepID=UPI00071E8F11|nr:CARDB domain-containing protein [Haloparvum sedimenti]